MCINLVNIDIEVLHGSHVTWQEQGKHKFFFQWEKDSRDRQASLTSVSAFKVKNPGPNIRRIAIMHGSIIIIRFLKA